MKKSCMLAALVLGLSVGSAGAFAAEAGVPFHFDFKPQATTGKFLVADMLKAAANAPADWDVPADWSDYGFAVIEWRASSSERFQLEIYANDGEGGKEVMVAKRIEPFGGTWVRAVVPLAFFRKPAGEGGDLAATFNKHRDSYAMNINFGGWAPIRNVTAIGFEMDGPIAVDGKAPSIEVRSVKLSKTDPGDAVLDPKVVVDKFGQWIPAQWPGKAHTLEDLQKAWAAEDAALKPGEFGFDKYGGYANTTAKATGFFRVEQIDGKWWFVDPDGHLFYSTGLNGVGTNSATPASSRIGIFESFDGMAPRGRSSNAPTYQQASFYTLNLQRRFGDQYMGLWGEFTYRRLDAWGFNTIAGFGNTAPTTVQSATGQHKPYTIMMRGQMGPAIMGMPDVYSADFAARAETMAQQCDKFKDDPLLLGYFVGNEPPWPGREFMLCDAIMAGADSAIKTKLAEWLKAGDTAARRKEFVYAAFDTYLATINAAIKKHDPNHLNIGIRLGGDVPDEVYRAARNFDVCSINVYDFSIDPKMLDKIVRLTGRPMIVGEFHFGVPERGMGGGLRQVATQKDKGLAYQYYVENAAAHPNMIGTHWFQWIDQPSTGRNDGENFNIGLIDVTDQPYAEVVSAMAATHKRLFAVHSGKVAPTNVQPQGKSTAEIQLEHTTMIPPAK